MRNLLAVVVLAMVVHGATVKPSVELRRDAVTWEKRDNYVASWHYLNAQAAARDSVQNAYWRAMLLHEAKRCERKGK